MSLLAAAYLMATLDMRTPHLLQPFNEANALGRSVASEDLTKHAAAITLLMSSVPRQFAARGMLPVTRMCFAQPWSLPETAARLSDRALATATPARRIARLAAAAFALPDPGTASSATRTLIADTPQQAVAAMNSLLSEPTRQLKEALARLDSAATVPARITAAIEAALGGTDKNAPQLEQLLGTLNAASHLDRATLVAALALLDVQLATASASFTGEAASIPDDLSGAVTGNILAAQLFDDLGWIVVGSTDANTYDMTRIAAVFDPGGDDTYTWKGVVTGSRAIVDLAGNDRYTGADFAGPAGAIAGVSVIMDEAGDDRYSGHTLCNGAAFFGVALLVDRAGNDTYTAERWSVGSAIAGIGAVVDVSGVDTYDAPLFSQGVGGPSAVGVLLDLSGDDRYRADRTQPSVYETPATWVAFSQGCAFGYRVGGAAGTSGAGGVGALLDAAGNDRYECGEFGQGCGYFLGVGMLRDCSGDDFYVGNRYAQGTAAHQAFGILDDGAGNDIYHAVTAADQGGAWDMCAAMLIDRGGDDVYRGGSLSQGAAAQQAIGALVDFSGDDVYIALGASQGEADGNQYHWETTGCPSFALLWDMGGRNRFSSGRHDGQRLRTGTDQPPSGADGRTQWGLFLSP